jgi:hypothetical protein
MGGIAGAVLAAVRTGAITPPEGQNSTQGAQTSGQVSRAAERTAADKQWASATCTNTLTWKNEIQRDETSTRRARTDRRANELRTRVRHRRGNVPGVGLGDRGPDRTEGCGTTPEPCPAIEE